ncbi:MAG: BglII/BstYI family type II restriction endonuclease [Terrimicrobiaceae bacterium]|nr:BglII/BstYI family type II restriction endonuclease [Terrimicrobiaceae bacterium]
MAIETIPEDIASTYEIHEWRHAWAILATDFPEEFNDLISVLRDFRLKSSYIIVGGGNKGPIAKALDGRLGQLGWRTKNFDTKVVLDGAPLDSPTHEIDCFKGKVALEIEWNNKDPFFDRDLNNFRLLFELRAISVGVIITRCTHLHERTFKPLPYDVRKKYGASTTHMDKLLPKLHGGGGGGCPIIVIGIGERQWEEDIPMVEAAAVFKHVKAIKAANKGKKPKDRVIPKEMLVLNGRDLSSMLGVLREENMEDEE